MKNAEHHAHPAISSSGLKLIDQSPLHYWAAYLDPDCAPRKSTDAQEFGTAFHTITLEPELFATQYAIIPAGIDRRSKDGKAWFAEREDAGITCISQKDGDKIAQMRNAVARTKLFKKIDTRPTIVETSIFWHDADGIECKARPDIFVLPCDEYPHGLIIDLKSTKDASPQGFPRQLWSLKMYIQAALYAEGCKAHYKTAALPPFVWLAVENESPFCAAAYSCPAELMDFGIAEVARLKAIYKSCLDSKIWHGYPQEVAELELAGWMVKAMQDDEVSVEIRHV